MVKPVKKKPVSKNGLRAAHPKKVKSEYIKKFWREWDKPDKAKKLLIVNSEWHRKVWAVSPTVLATVRIFTGKNSNKEARMYVKNSRVFEKRIMSAKPEKFVLQPVEFLGSNEGKLLERVYRGVDLNHLKLKKSTPRYLASLKRRLKRKGIDLEKESDFLRVNKAAEEAFEEINKILKTKLKEKLPILRVNCLLLDFDPKTGKVLIASVDHGNPPSKKEGLTP